MLMVVFHAPYVLITQIKRLKLPSVVNSNDDELICT